MAEHDPWIRLSDLADFAEQQAAPLPVARVRRLGAQRRHRRHALTTATVTLVLVLGGGLLFTQLGAGTTRAPDPVATGVVTATPSPGPGRTVTAANLLSTGDVPLQVATDRVVITDPGVGRDPSALSVCVPDDLDLINATTVLNRNFRVEISDPSFTPDPADPLYGQPTVYTQTLQFADAELAEQARWDYQGRVESCLDRLEASSTLEPIGTDWGVDWRDVRSGGRSVGSFTEVPTYRQRDDRSENGYFETVGLTRVADRLTITVDLTYGNEKHYSLDQGGDPTSGQPADPQFALVQAAAKRLPG